MIEPGSIAPTGAPPTLRWLSPLALRPTEESIPDRIREVIALIVAQQAWTQPVCVERDSLALLDGHHRRAAALQLGFARIPVYLYDYAEVDIRSWRADMAPTKAEVVLRAETGRLYPHKTTRHIFTGNAAIDVGLRDLLPRC